MWGGCCMGRFDCTHAYLPVDSEIYMVIFETGYYTIHAFQTEWKLYFHTSCAIIY